MIWAFIGIMLLSLLLALWSRRGHSGGNAAEFFTAAGQFGAVLFFFLSVGETYSVASMLGFPGGVYARGDGFVAWFFGYILMAAPVLFFVGPWIWRAGRLYGAATIPDFFRAHFDSRALELFITLFTLLLLIPLGTQQFLGLRLVLSRLDAGAPPIVLTCLAGALTFAFVSIAGLRSSAYVAILKDLLMVASILAVGIMAILYWPQAITTPVARVASVPSGQGALFSMSTILVQALGFAMVPQTWAFLFSARSVDSIRKAQAVAPLYMLMFPLLMVIALYARVAGIDPGLPDFVFLASAGTLLPQWLLGVVLAAVTLAGLVVLSSVCLAIGPLVSRNLVAGMAGEAQQRWAKLVMAGYLLLSIIGAQIAPPLMVTLNNLYFLGIVQILPGFVAALCFAWVSARGIIAGIVAGAALSFLLFKTDMSPGGINPGVEGLILNALVMMAVSRYRPRIDSATVVQRLRLCDERGPLGPMLFI